MPVISPENIPTMVAAGVVSSLLCFAYTINVTRELKLVTNGAAALDVKAARRDEELARQIKELTERVKTLEAAAAAPVADSGVATDPAVAGDAKRSVGASLGAAPAP